MNKMKWFNKTSRMMVKKKSKNFKILKKIKNKSTFIIMTTKKKSKVDRLKTNPVQDN